MVIGRNGQVAQALQFHLPNLGADVVTIGRPEVDLLNPERAEQMITKEKPTLVVLAAAYTAVDQAEDDADTAHQINAVAPGIIARAAAKVAAPVLHFSTDYVFDGKSQTPYPESAQTGPETVYGRTKLEGEARLAAENPHHIILRTSWVCSPTGRNFVKTILRLSNELNVIRVVSDQVGTPTFANDLAWTVGKIAARIHGEQPLDANCWGLFHVSGAGETSWYEFASAIVQGAVRRGGKNVQVEPIPTCEYPTRAIRPAFSKLDTTKIRVTYGIDLAPWHVGLEACLDELVGPILNTGI